MARRDHHAGELVFNPQHCQGSMTVKGFGVKNPDPAFPQS